MKTKRNSIPKRIRFAVFARDGFRCRYCGKTSEHVELVIDHLMPVAKGGKDEVENLVTACAPCNSGKSDKTIEQAALPEAHRLAIAQEMQEQVRALKTARKANNARKKLRQEVCNFYCEQMEVEDISKIHLSHYVSMVEKHGVEQVFHWIEIAARKVRFKREHEILRYVYGIRRRVFEEQGGQHA